MASTTTLEFLLTATDRASGVFDKVGDSADRQSRAMGRIKAAGAVAVAAGAAAAVKFGADSVTAYKESEEAQNRLSDAYTKFPALADVNIDKLRDLNTALQKKTGIDDDETAAAQATLAQYKLSGEQIAKLTPLLQDYSAKTGKTLPDAAKVLGKAMLGQGRALKDVGLNFKDAGSLAGNFDQVVAGLGEQVGGFAEKQASTATGKTKLLATQFGDLQETVGQKLVPALSAATDIGLKVVDWLGRSVGWLGPLLLGIGAAVAVWKTWTIAQAALNVVMSANPIGLIVTAVAGLVAGLVLFFTKTETGKKVWAGFTAFLSSAWERIKAAFTAGVAVVRNVLGVAQRVIKTVWSYSPLGLIVSNWDKITGFFAAIPERVGAFFRRAVDLMKTVWSFTPLGMIVKNWSKITGFFASIPGKVKGYFSAAVGWLKSAGSNVLTGLQSGLTAGWTAVTSWISGRKDAVLSSFSGAASWLYESGKNVVQGLLNGVGSLASTVGSWFLDKIPSWIRDPFKKALGIASPSKVFKGFGRNVIEGLVAGLGGSLDKVKASIAKLVETLRSTKGLQGRDALVDLVRSRGRELTGAIKAQDLAVARLERSQERLKTLVQARKEMANQVSEGISGQFDLSSTLGGTDEHGYKVATTFGSVSGAVKAMVAKAKKFALLMKKMVKVGIPRGLVQQVAAMGIDDGIEVGNALVSGSASEIKDLRRSWAELDRWSDSAGRTVAGQQYDKAIDNQRDVVRERQQRAAQAEAERKALAKELAAEFERMLLRVQVKADVKVDAALAIDGRGAAQVTKVGILELRRSGDRTV